MSQRKAMVSIIIMAAFLHWEIVFDSLPFRNKLVSVGCGCWTVIHCYITMKIKRKHKVE